MIQIKKAENHIADKDYKSENSTATATEHNSQNDLTKESPKSDSPVPDNNFENIQTAPVTVYKTTQHHLITVHKKTKKKSLYI